MSRTGAGGIRGITWRFAGIVALGLAAASCGSSEEGGRAPAARSPGRALTTGAGTGFTLEGCRNDGSITLPDGGGRFVCPDAAYTTGNLGKGWNELDLVPHRLTVDTGNSAPAIQAFAVAVAVDSEDAGHPGYDVLSAPVLDAARSSTSCAAATVGPQATLAPGVGGTDRSLYRIVTLTQAKNLTCVYDFYARLALGSHLYPGSSLHANALNDEFGTAGIGARDVSIPVKEILPQELTKDMSASQGSDHVWNVTKTPAPAHVDFGNTCDPAAPLRYPAVTVTVAWVRQAAEPDGPVTILTHVYAINPASRTITVDVTDRIHAGTDQAILLDTASSGGVAVGPNSTALVLTHTFTWSTPDAGSVNDVASATYTDQETGIPVPRTTTAAASAAIQSTGPELNALAVVNDVESISGTGLTFSTDAFNGAAGSFDGGYALGAETAGPVSWTSATQAGDGEVRFGKTVYVTPFTATSGALEDVATLIGSNGFTASASGRIAITAETAVALSIRKTLPNALAADATFAFDVCRGPIACAANEPGFVQTVAITLPAGALEMTATLPGLAPDEYTVREQPTGTGWKQPADQSASLPGRSLESCAATLTFRNEYQPARAEVRKITLPAGGEAGWSFRLTGPGIDETVTTTGAASEPFAAELVQSGTYAITEIPQAGWDVVGPSSCQFTVDLPGDGGRGYACTFTNLHYARVNVQKTEGGGLPTHDWAFSLYAGGATPPTGAPLEAATANGANGGAVSFATHLDPTATYTLCEPLGPGWSTTWSMDGAPIAPAIDGTAALACFAFAPAAGATIGFAVDNRPPPGGGQRTIGYWKNWNSCTGFVPYPTAPAKGFTTLDDVLPIGVDDVLTLSTCGPAASLLGKRDLCTGLNRASDPAYGLAAQLVAAIANVKAHATDCGGTVEPVIVQAQALLTKFGFTGCGGYKARMSPLDQLRAQALAARLDAYDNGSCTF